MTNNSSKTISVTPTNTIPEINDNSKLSIPYDTPFYLKGL
jgi:hypothetical protein